MRAYLLGRFFLVISVFVFVVGASSLSIICLELELLLRAEPVSSAGAACVATVFVVRLTHTTQKRVLASDLALHHVLYLLKFVVSFKNISATSM
jgi:hypothetical protein